MDRPELSDLCPLWRDDDGFGWCFGPACAWWVETGRGLRGCAVKVFAEAAAQALLVWAAREEMKDDPLGFNRELPKRLEGS